ncbi:hypothetical protein CAL7716_044520 [Calothrix sp. PCC 7716]|nr:hypothetical protein CAL7716_044520 [Calothrix sp. PCC 7716]
MKVCYFIQAHKNPEQVYRLVRTIKKSSPNSLVVIGYDFTNSSISMGYLQDLPGVYLLRANFSIERGSFSILQPYLNCINWLYSNNLNYDWLAYISGQDYPAQSLSDTESFLSKTEYDGFIEFYNVLSEQSHWSINEGLHRYFNQYYTRLLTLWEISRKNFMLFLCRRNSGSTCEVFDQLFLYKARFDSKNKKSLPVKKSKKSVG